MLYHNVLLLSPSKLLKQWHPLELYQHHKTSILGKKYRYFGLLSRSTKSHEECHFCLDSIVENKIFNMETPCCGHTSHCRCFQKMGSPIVNGLKEHFTIYS